MRERQCFCILLKLLENGLKKGKIALKYFKVAFTNNYKFEVV